MIANRSWGMLWSKAVPRFGAILRRSRLYFYEAITSKIPNVHGVDLRSDSQRLSPQSEGLVMLRRRVCCFIGAAVLLAISGSAAVNNPPVANPDNYTVNEDTTLYVGTPGVLANDTDAER